MTNRVFKLLGYFRVRSVLACYGRWFRYSTNLVLISALLACKTESTKHSFVSLFDGNTFKGWEGDTSETFRIEGGAIIGGSLVHSVPRNEFLCTRRCYTNFELRLKCKLAGSAEANGGIQFRSRRVPNDTEVAGYQADMAEYMNECWWGSLYDESRRKRFLAQPDLATVRKTLRKDDWNDYIIRCEGRRIRLWLNGLQMVDFVEPDDRVEDYGIIGLQIHRGQPSEAAYKNICIKEFP